MKGDPNHVCCFRGANKRTQTMKYSIQVFGRYLRVQEIRVNDIPTTCLRWEGSIGGVCDHYK